MSGELRQTLMFGILSGVLVALFCYLLALGAILKERSLTLLAIFVCLLLCLRGQRQAFVESLMVPGALKLSRFTSIIATLGCYAGWTAFLLRYLHTAFTSSTAHHRPCLGQPCGALTVVARL